MTYNKIICKVKSENKGRNFMIIEIYWIKNVKLKIISLLSNNNMLMT